MKKALLVLSIIVLCCSFSHSQVFQDIDVDTDKCVGALLIGGSLYAMSTIVTPTVYGVGGVCIVFGCGLIFGSW